MKCTHQGGVTGVHVTLGRLLNDIQIVHQLRKLSQVFRRLDTFWELGYIAIV